MTRLQMPPALADILQAHYDPATVFEAVLPLLGEILSYDRCFLYLRHPKTRWGQIAACWRRSDVIPDLADRTWKQEDSSQLEDQDPLFAAALACQSDIYVDDIDTASPTTINLAYERQYFGHRALAHIHITRYDELWGILEPAVFVHPREWEQFDRSVLGYTREHLLPLIINYVESHHPEETH
ncbi:MAG: GAF domain-containing protein [Cyanobacteria bacterium P01_A01_bin.123]